jgi:cAMP-dependent protein kinase regulator
MQSAATAESVVEPTVRVLPFTVGARTAARAIVRITDGPHYATLTTEELQLATELTASAVPVSEFLARHLGKNDGIDFRGALSLLVKLHQSGFLAGSSTQMSAKLADLSRADAGRLNARVATALAKIGLLLDWPLVAWTNATVSPALRFVGKIFVSWPFLVVGGAGFAALVARGGQMLWPRADAWVADFAAPELLLLKICVLFALAASALGFLQMAALAGAGARFVGGSVRLTAFTVLRLSVDDDDAFVLSPSARLRYRLLTLASPWFMAALSWQAMSLPGMGAAASLVAGAFVLLGLTSLAPLRRSPLVKTMEGFVATMSLTARANAYLGRGLLTGLSKQAGRDLGSAREEMWIVVLASLTLIWLYGMSLLFADALLAVVPDLWATVSRPVPSLRTVAAGVILSVLGLAFVAALLKLVSIPLQNVAAVAALPLRRARRGVHSFQNPGLSPSAALATFLREIPFLSELSDGQMALLMRALVYRRFGPGELIVQRGEAGDDFYILADGEAQVMIAGRDGGDEVVDVLRPGDSFGEIALIESVRRTATVQTLTAVKTLALPRRAFDQLFPEGGEERQRLTRTIRLVKLLVESAALSHLAPRQIRELLRLAKPVTIPAGGWLLREGDSGDAAYMIESGEVDVVKERTSEHVARLGRGELVGAVALIKGIGRTASVRAATDVSALMIDKGTFLRMCLSNVLVATVVADLAERQVAASRVIKPAG